MLQQLAQKDRQIEKEKEALCQAEISNPNTSDSRRKFLKRSSALFGGVSLGSFMFSSTEDAIAQTTSKVNRLSNPSELKITDMRYCVLQLDQNGGSRNPIIRIDTNQGIYGLGEVRDAADERYALFLKSRILGENPCNVELLFKIIKQFGNHGLD